MSQYKVNYSPRHHRLYTEYIVPTNTVTCSTRRALENGKIDASALHQFTVCCFCNLVHLQIASTIALFPQRIGSSRFSPHPFVCPLTIEGPLFARAYPKESFRIMAHVSHSQLEEPTAHSPSHPSPTSSSDKENPQTSNKRTQMSSASASKRRRLTDRTFNTQSQMASSRRNDSKQYYDPDQDPEERRNYRKGVRDLQSDVHGRKTHQLVHGR